MENLFSRRLPLEQRYGSRLVFRQGNPLSLADLDLVSAGEGSGGVGCVVRGGGRGHVLLLPEPMARWCESFVIL